MNERWNKTVSKKRRKKKKNIVAFSITYMRRRKGNQRKRKQWNRWKKIANKTTFHRDTHRIVLSFRFRELPSKRIIHIRRYTNQMEHCLLDFRLNSHATSHTRCITLLPKNGGEQNKKDRDMLHNWLFSLARTWAMPYCHVMDAGIFHCRCLPLNFLGFNLVK